MASTKMNMFGSVVSCQSWAHNRHHSCCGGVLVLEGQEFFNLSNCQEATKVSNVDVDPGTERSTTTVLTLFSSLLLVEFNYEF